MAVNIAHWLTRARWVSATGLGSTVAPEENWMSARSSGCAAGAVQFPAGAGSPATVRHPSRGRARATASPSSARMSASVSTTAAPTLESSRAVVAPYSASRPRRTGGYSGTGTPPASSVPKNASTNSGEVGSTIATRSPRRTPSSTSPAAARSARASTSAQLSATSRSRRSAKVIPEGCRAAATSTSLRVPECGGGAGGPFTACPAPPGGPRAARGRRRSRPPPRPGRRAGPGNDPPARPRG